MGEKVKELYSALYIPKAKPAKPAPKAKKKSKGKAKKKKRKPRKNQGVKRRRPSP